MIQKGKEADQQIEFLGTVIQDLQVSALKCHALIHATHTYIIHMYTRVYAYVCVCICMYAYCMNLLCNVCNVLFHLRAKSFDL